MHDAEVPDAQGHSGRTVGSASRGASHSNSRESRAEQTRKRCREFLSIVKSKDQVHEKRKNKNYTPNIILALCMLMENEKDILRACVCREAVVHCATDWSDLAWGCGYRNTQQILSSLLEADPAFYKKATGCSDVLNIREIQLGIEEAWRIGIDEEGANQLQWRVVDSKKWIGTTEVYAFLTNLGYDTTIVQFSGADHTAKLLDFCKHYFQIESQDPVGFRIVKTDQHPLYFQHQGHSRTIVGYMQYRTASYLLVFDPAKRPSAGLRKLSRAADDVTSAPSGVHSWTNGSSILKAWKIDEKSLKKKEYQLLRINGILEHQGLAQKKIIRPYII